MEKDSSRQIRLHAAFSVIAAVLAFWAAHGLLRFVILFRNNPYGIPFVAKPDWYIFHALCIDYIWIAEMAVPFLLLALFLPVSAKLHRFVLPVFCVLQAIILPFTLLDGCRFPGLCPSLPLDWSNIHISENFDFDGHDRLLAEDAFLGPGEAPVHPVLPGVVIAVGKDSLGTYVEIDHGNNVSSRTSGLASSAAVGDTVDLNSVVGRLPPKDSAEYFLSVRRNGLFVRWADFYRMSHLVDSVEIAKFKARIGF